MEKFFNTAGPMIPEEHYCIPPLERVDWPDVRNLIDRKRYFLLHAPRQTGKTTALLAMMKVLNEEDRYNTLYVNIEAAQAARNDVQGGMQVVCEAIGFAAETWRVEPRLPSVVGDLVRNTDRRGILTTVLTKWSRMSEKPVVLFLDGVDALIGDTLVSLLRQIRAGYAQRPDSFPQSIVLCGVRDIQDYRIHQSDGEIITGGSAFNIKAESLRMGNFDYHEMRLLLRQHADATGQEFDDAIFQELWFDTKGQPWLVNAMAHEMTWKDRSARDRSTLLSLEIYRSARERLVCSRATHLDQLTDKLKEERVHRIIGPILSGEEPRAEYLNPDLSYVYDLGLIDRREDGVLDIANRIYKEVIPRELTWATQESILQNQAWYVTPDHHLDMRKILQAFQAFFRENAESWIERFDYKEAGPQLVMQAFLQRIVNGGGRITREYGLGRGRTDLAIEWPTEPGSGFYGDVQKVLVELKLYRPEKQRLESVIESGIEQSMEYADTFGAEEIHLVIFNRSDAPWDEKIRFEEHDFADRTVGVWGC